MKSIFSSFGKDNLFGHLVLQINIVKFNLLMQIPIHILCFTFNSQILKMFKVK